MIFKYPYTDLYNLNLDWVIQAIKEVQETITNLGTVVNTFNGQSGDVTLSAADITSIVGGIVNSFNGRTGAVTLTEADVNQTLIDIVWTSDPGEVIGDLSQSTLNELFAAGRRVLIFNNARGEPDRIYFLTLVGDVVTPQQYIPTGAIAGVASVNGQTGAVTVRGDTIPVSGTDPTTVKNALAAKEDVLTFDQTPTAGSTNPVTSEGIQAADAAIRTDLATLSNTVSGIDNRLESAEQGLTYAEQDISSLSQQITNLGPYNGLDSTSTTAALSASRGKYLHDNGMLFKGAGAGSMNDYTDTGIYYGSGVSDCPPGTGGFGGFAVFNVADAGSRASTAQFYWGYNLTRPYFRQYNHAAQAWTNWEQLVSESALHLSNSYNWINSASIVVPANHVYLFTSFRSGDIGLIISYSDGATEYKAIAGNNWSGTSQGNYTILMSATNQADYQVTALM